MPRVLGRIEQSKIVRKREKKVIKISISLSMNFSILEIILGSSQSKSISYFEEDINTVIFKSIRGKKLAEF